MDSPEADVLHLTTDPAGRDVLICRGDVWQIFGSHAVGPRQWADFLTIACAADAQAAARYVHAHRGDLAQPGRIVRGRTVIFP